MRTGLWPKIAAGVMTASVAASGGCGTSNANSGVCTGEKDGEIYYLQILNFVNSKLRVYVDGHEVGNVGAYDTLNHVPAYRNLGTLPQCSTGTINFSNTSAIYLTSIEWTRDAMELSDDRCKVEIALVEVEDEFPSDWIEYDMRMPGSYTQEDDTRTSCANWKYYFRLDGNDPVGTPTPTVTDPTRTPRF